MSALLKLASKSASKSITKRLSPHKTKNLLQQTTKRLSPRKSKSTTKNLLQQTFNSPSQSTTTQSTPQLSLPSLPSKQSKQSKQKYTPPEDSDTNTVIMPINEYLTNEDLNISHLNPTSYYNTVKNKLQTDNHIVPIESYYAFPSNKRKPIKISKGEVVHYDGQVLYNCRMTGPIFEKDQRETGSDLLLYTDDTTCTVIYLVYPDAIYIMAPTINSQKLVEKKAINHILSTDGIDKLLRIYYLPGFHCSQSDYSDVYLLFKQVFKHFGKTYGMKMFLIDETNLRGSYIGYDQQLKKGPFAFDKQVVLDDLKYDDYLTMDAYLAKQQIDAAKKLIEEKAKQEEVRDTEQTKLLEDKFQQVNNNIEQTQIQITDSTNDIKNNIAESTDDIKSTVDTRSQSTNNKISKTRNSLSKHIQTINSNVNDTIEVQNEKLESLIGEFNDKLDRKTEEFNERLVEQQNAHADQIDHILENMNNQKKGDEEQIGGSVYRRKYMKYKYKYLMLKG